MDPFTQRLLEKAEQRSRAHGINSNFSISECAALTSPVAAAATNLAPMVAVSQMQTQTQSRPQSESQPQTQPHLHSQQRSEQAHSSNIGNVGNIVNKLQVVERRNIQESRLPTGVGNYDSITKNNTNDDRNSNLDGSSPNKKVLRHFSAVDKENMDLGIEINILTDKNVEVQVQVEEQDITNNDNGNGNSWKSQIVSNENPNKPLAQLRDTSRNRLQRLGALYSNSADLSSPIHRTEGKFHAEPDHVNFEQQNHKKSKTGLGKLAALAQTINQWEDEDSPHHIITTCSTSSAIPPPKPALPSRNTLTANGNKNNSNEQQKPEENNRDTGRQLKWDSKVLNSLEAQGFQRIDSSDVKLSYDFEAVTTAAAEVENKRQIGKLSSSKFTGLITQSKTTSDNDKKSKQNSDEMGTTGAVVKPGLVSGRAAVFEAQAQSSKAVQQKPQKDPTELSLKERMKLFERNKGEALLPKAAFGMAPPISKILQDSHNKAKEEAATINQSYNPPLIKLQKDSKLREKVNALVNATNENRIKEDIRKQREEDLQVLANRFNYQKDIFKENQSELTANKLENQRSTVEKKSPKKLITNAPTRQGKKDEIPLPPPPPPPPPVPIVQSTTAFNSNYHTLAKRRSSSNNAVDDEKKRARKTNQQQQQQQQQQLQYCNQQPLISKGSGSLSEADTNYTFSDNENNLCSTATLSAINTADEMQATAAATHPDMGDSDEDSYSLAEKSSRILYKRDDRVTAVTSKNSEEKKMNAKVKTVHYAIDNERNDIIMKDNDSSSISSSLGVNDYLEEAFVAGGTSSGAIDADMTDDDNNDDDDDISGDKENFDNSETSQDSHGTTKSHSFSFRRTHSKQQNLYATAFGQSKEYKNDIGNQQSEDFVTTTPQSATTTTTTTATSGSSYEMQPVKSELSINKNDDNMVTLVHTVSFYRRQQNSNSASSTPIRRISREEQVLRSTLNNYNNESLPPPPPLPPPSIHYEDSDEESITSDMESEDALVKEKIQKLLSEVCKQQQVITQTSQALNLCAATVEFSGSAESVEGERHLLVASHRRQACLDEVQRLGIEKSIRPLNAPKERGCLTVQEITLPLRQDYIRKMAADTISGHHLVCLLKYNEHVLATKTIPTLPGLLAVKFPDVLHLNNVYADFKVTLAIYGMTAQREVLPHEVKYHINVNKKSAIKTPKKKGGGGAGGSAGVENRLVMPPVQSPGGPQVVRTPALVQYGYAIFSLREVQRTTWSLTQVSGVSPLDGVVHMKINCELSVTVEYKSFLTMFEDISGFGAWHRRWCHLNGTILSYWKYPDDEKKKAPMGSIDLYTCITQKVCTAPRDICARLNTMLLECQRPAKDTDRESLIMIPNGRTTIVRYLLSADTKEEREEWCSYFNKTLTLLRAWGPPQY